MNEPYLFHMEFSSKPCWKNDGGGGGEVCVPMGE